MEIEYSRVKDTEGNPVRRTEVERSLNGFQHALAARGGSMPPGMRWSEGRGFHYPGSTMTLAEARARLLQVEREIRWEATRLALPPGLAALAAKIDRAMR